jgi:hypothetical protein
VFLFCVFLFTLINYAFDYKPINRSQILDKQEIKLLKENSNLNKKHSSADLTSRSFSELVDRFNLIKLVAIYVSID